MLFQKLGILLIIAIFIQACSVAPAWRKSDVNKHDTETALAACRYEVGLKQIPTSQRGQLVTDCMAAKGFRYR